MGRSARSSAQVNIEPAEEEGRARRLAALAPVDRARAVAAWAEEEAAIDRLMVMEAERAAARASARAAAARESLNLINRLDNIINTYN